MAETYKYYAFISFQSSDAKEAVRLQHAIENYRLPAVLCKHDKDIPRRVRPLYCYLNDIHAGEELMQELKARMEQSRYLIVVCSPRSAKSAYVNGGIDYFVALGRRDSIIPVIVDGVPYSGNEETECFPEALRRHFPKHPDPQQDHSILGINLREEGVSRRKAQDRAMLMVVARILQLDFDGLLLREKQRHRRLTIGWSALGACIALLIGLTWHLSQSVEVRMGLQETTPQNAGLPPIQDIVCTLHLDNESKTDTFASPTQTLSFPNIPPRFIGKEVRIELRSALSVPMDTMIVLNQQMLLPLRRDPDMFGHLRFKLRGVPRPESVSLHIGSQTVRPQADGQVELFLPIEQQQTSYAIDALGLSDTLYMPCGEDDIIWLQ